VAKLAQRVAKAEKKARYASDKVTVKKVAVVAAKRRSCTAEEVAKLERKEEKWKNKASCLEHKARGLVDFYKMCERTGEWPELDGTWSDDEVVIYIYK
jgi:hypothetical protein